MYVSSAENARRVVNGTLGGAWRSASGAGRDVIGVIPTDVTAASPMLGDERLLAHRTQSRAHSP